MFISTSAKGLGARELTVVDLSDIRSALLEVWVLVVLEETLDEALITGRFLTGRSRVLRKFSRTGCLGSVGSPGTGRPYLPATAPRSNGAAHCLRWALRRRQVKSCATLACFEVFPFLDTYPRFIPGSRGFANLRTTFQDGNFTSSGQGSVSIFGKARTKHT